MQLTACYKHINIIAMTANAFDEDVKACLDAGMCAHIAKPIDCEKMLSTISEFCPTTTDGQQQDSQVPYDQLD